MKVHVLLKTNLAPEVRVDHGGGEIGWTSVAGVYFTKEQAEYEAAYSAWDFIMELSAGDPHWEENLGEDGPWEDLDYIYRWDVEECEMGE